MWKILSWVAVGLLAVAAFFSYRNTAQFKAERELLAVAQQNAQDVEQQLAAARQALNENQIARKKVEDEITARDKSIADAKAKADALAQEADNQKPELEKITSRLDDLKVQIGQTGSLDEVKDKLAQLQQEKAQMEEEVSALRNQIAVAVERAENLSNQINTMRIREAWQSAGVIEDDFRSRVRSVDNDWGFVVLDAGNRSGVVSGAVLDVVRGGQQVGQLRVTNVEQNRAVADIIDGSVAAGNAIQPGDSVRVSRQSSASQWRLNQQSIQSAPQPAEGTPAEGTPADGQQPQQPAPGAQPDLPEAPSDPFASPDPFGTPAQDAAPAQPADPFGSDAPAAPAETPAAPSDGAPMDDNPFGN